MHSTNIINDGKKPFKEIASKQWSSTKVPAYIKNADYPLLFKQKLKWNSERKKIITYCPFIYEYNTYK